MERKRGRREREEEGNMKSNGKYPELLTHLGGKRGGGKQERQLHRFPYLILMECHKDGRGVGLNMVSKSSHHRKPISRAGWAKNYRGAQKKNYGEA